MKTNMGALVRITCPLTSPPLKAVYLEQRKSTGMHYVRIFNNKKYRIMELHSNEFELIDNVY